MSIEEMLESDDYEIFELGLSLKEKRDGCISLSDATGYARRMHEKIWGKIVREAEKQVWFQNIKIQKYESK